MRSHVFKVAELGLEHRLVQLRETRVFDSPRHCRRRRERGVNGGPVGEVTLPPPFTGCMWRLRPCIECYAELD